MYIAYQKGSERTILSIKQQTLAHANELYTVILPHNKEQQITVQLICSQAAEFSHLRLQAAICWCSNLNSSFEKMLLKIIVFFALFLSEHIGSQKGLGWKGPQSPPSPNPCHAQGCPPPAQSAQGPIQPGLQCPQGWGTHSFWTAVPGPQHSERKIF